VISRLEEQTLQSIAAAADGAYLRMSGAGESLAVLRDRLQRLQVARHVAGTRTLGRDRFYFFVAGLALLLVVVYVPFLQPIFNTTALGWEQWQYILPMIFIPALAAESSKPLLTRFIKG
jgi:type II secretory pathway component PulM